MKALVTFLNKNERLVDGISTQMHISLTNSYSGINYAFQTLSSTGLKVKISEIDVAFNTAKAKTFTPDAIIRQ